MNLSVLAFFFRGRATQGLPGQSGWPKTDAGVVPEQPARTKKKRNGVIRCCECGGFPSTSMVHPNEDATNRHSFL